jgi:hypothetical protein
MKEKDKYHPKTNGQCWVTTVENDKYFYAFPVGGYAGSIMNETARAFGEMVRDYYPELRYARIKQRRQYLYGIENFNSLVKKS